ncbi:MAG: hypothetical protein OXI44_02200 [Bacteroidota bacterium]|nr:hypothetical protein [Bacteroidota bacterium]
MKRTAFNIAYTGPAVDSGTMDVTILAPALFAIGKLFESVNEVVNEDRATMKVHVKATDMGSFSVELQLLQDLSDHILNLFKAAGGVAGLYTIFKLIFGKRASLLTLIRWIKNKNIDKEESLPNGNIRITVEGRTEDVSELVYNLYKNAEVRRNLDDSIRKPLLIEDIDKVKIHHKDQKREITQEITKEEAEYFTPLEQSEHVVIDEVRKIGYTVQVVSFIRGNSWRLYDGSTLLYVKIEDSDFLERVDKGEISFRKDDFLLCDVRVMQMLVNDRLTTKHFVQKVIKHEQAAQQLGLFDTSDDLKS